MAKLSGPRMRGGKYYSKGKVRGRPRKYVKSAASKRRSAPKMIKNIVKKQINSLAETKYFNSAPLSTLTRMTPFASRSVATAVDVLAFAVGTGEQIGIGTTSTADYGFISGTGNVPVEPLNMCRAFGEANSDPAVRKNKIDGAYVSPSLCKTEWLIEFPQVNTTSVLNNIEQANPMYMRMIRVVPRQRKYQDVQINPKGDLFVDQFGEATGVNTPSFNQLELQMYKINSRKYQVIQDYQQVLVPTSTFSTYAIGTSNTAVTNLTRFGNRLRISCIHNQPKKLFYTEMDTNGNVNNGAQPQAGQSNELIFFHFTSLGTGGNTTASNDIEVTCKTVSTFKDL